MVRFRTYIVVGGRTGDISTVKMSLCISVMIAPKGRICASFIEYGFSVPYVSSLNK